jgi:Transglutaminase-like superfamily
MLRPRHFLLTVLALGFLWTPIVRPDQPKAQRLSITVKDVDESLEAEWFGLYFQGKKIGYFNSSRSKVTDDGQSYYRDKSFISMKLQSFGQKSEIKIDQTFDFESKPPFRLVRAEYNHTDDKLHIKHGLVAQGESYNAIIAVGKELQVKKIDNLDFTLADSMSSELWLKRKPKIGDKITTQDLEMEDLKLELSTATLLDTKESLVNGVKVVFHEVQSINLKTKIVSDSKYDDQGHLLSGTIAGVFEMRRETEELAKNTEFSTDLFILGAARIDKGLGDTSKLSSLILEINKKEGAMLPNGPRQTLKADGGDTVLLCIGKKHGDNIKATESDIKDGLEETTAYPISDAKIKALAKKAVGKATTDLQKAKNICAFVNGYIKPSLSTTVPKMFDLMEKKAGDCKSYAMMFTCLARASGLPSREVSGFVYMGDAVKAFGGHAWNEVLLDGFWVPVDASMNQVDADPTHICLGTDKESANNLLKTFGKLKFKLIEAESGK